MSEGIVIKSDGNKSLEQIKADVAAFEANPVEPGAPDSTPAELAPAAVTPEQDVLPTPETPPEKEKTPDQQPKVTAEKAVSTAEPVKETDWKAAYEGLQRKFNKAFVEKKEPKEVPKPPMSFDGIAPEIEQRIVADLEKAPVQTLVNLIREISRNELDPIKSRLDLDDFQKQEAAKLSGLDRLASEGHDWIKTGEGLRKMEAVLTENPELWKTKDPYRAALGFLSDIPSKAGQRSSAQTTGLTPILGASGAMPPAVSTPAASKVDRLQGLLTEMNRQLSRGNIQKAQQIQAEMDEIDRG